MIIKKKSELSYSRKKKKENKTKSFDDLLQYKTSSDLSDGTLSYSGHVQIIMKTWANIRTRDSILVQISWVRVNHCLWMILLVVVLTLTKRFLYIFLFFSFLHPEGIWGLWSDEPFTMASVSFDKKQNGAKSDWHRFPCIARENNNNLFYTFILTLYIYSIDLFIYVYIFFSLSSSFFLFLFHICLKSFWNQKHVFFIEDTKKKRKKICWPS